MVFLSLLVPVSLCPSASTQVHTRACPFPNTSASSFPGPIIDHCVNRAYVIKTWKKEAGRRDRKTLGLSEQLNRLLQGPRMPRKVWVAGQVVRRLWEGHKGLWPCAHISTHSWQQSPAGSHGTRLAWAHQPARTRPQQQGFNRREAHFSAQGLLTAKGSHLFARCFQGAALLCVASPLPLLLLCSALVGRERKGGNRKTSLDQKLHQALVLTFYWLRFGHVITKLRGRLGNVVLYSEW